MSNSSFISKLMSKKDEFNLSFYYDFQEYEILKDICAYLNDNGGWIIVGHSGHKLNRSLILKETDIDKLESKIIQSISPAPLVYLSLEKHLDHKILLINVHSGSRQPYALNNNYFIRKSNKSVKAETDDISLMLRTSSEFVSSWEKMNAIDCSMDDLDDQEIELTINEAVKLGKEKVFPQNHEEFLNYFHLSDFGTIKNGAVVLFAIDPVKFLPQCRIRITVLPEGKTGTEFKDTETIEDNLFKAFVATQKYLSLNNPLISRFDDTDWNRRSERKFPVNALDEAVVNAMVHRDYSDISGEVTINIFPDKIEIINSGEIPADIVRGKNTIKPHHSILRNPTIAHIFYLRGKIEKLGRGLTLIRDSFEEAGYKKPEWIVENGYTKLTLFNKEFRINLNERMRKFLMNHKGDAFSRQEYEDFFKGEISEKTARNDLSELVDGGILIKSGAGRNTIYEKQLHNLPPIAG